MIENWDQFTAQQWQGFTSYEWATFLLMPPVIRAVLRAVAQGYSVPRAIMAAVASAERVGTAATFRTLAAAVASTPEVTNHD